MSKYGIEISLSSCGSRAITVRASIYEKGGEELIFNAGFCRENDSRIEYVEGPNWVERLLGISWERKVVKAQRKVYLAAERERNTIERREELIKLHKGPWKPPYRPDFIKAR